MNKIKVLCISASPRGAESESEKMLTQLMLWIKKYGGEAELLRLAEKNILQCEGCYSKTRHGEKCTYPCIHEGKDDTAEVLKEIVNADALAIATPIYWGSGSALIQRLIEKLTAVENNSDKFAGGKDPLEGKPFLLMCSQESEGASLALSQISWALNHLGMVSLPWHIFKQKILNRRIVRMGMRLIGERKFEWIDNTIRLGARNLVNVSKLLKGYEFDDKDWAEPRC